MGTLKIIEISGSKYLRKIPIGNYEPLWDLTRHSAYFLQQNPSNKTTKTL